MYEFIVDPGHGWLKVPLADLPEGFEPSEYSFRSGGFAYLEEDCDAPAFIAICELNDETFDRSVRVTQVEEFDRGLPRFPAKVAS